MAIDLAADSSVRIARAGEGALRTYSAGAGRENTARTSGLTLVGLPVARSMGHQMVQAFASNWRSEARSSSVWRSKRMREAAPTQVRARMESPRRAACL